MMERKRTLQGCVQPRNLINQNVQIGEGFSEEVKQSESQRIC